MNFSKLTFVKTPDLRIGFPPSERAIKLRLLDAFALKHGFMLRNGNAMNAVFTDYGLQANGSIIVEMAPHTIDGVQGDNPHGTKPGNGKEWKPSASKWLPKSISEIDRFLTQDVAHCVHEGRVFFDLSSVDFLSVNNAEDMAKAQAELDLENTPLLLVDATRRQLVERLLELETE